MSDDTRRELVARAEGIGLDIGGQTLLDDVSVDVARGEIVTLIGPNGAGKTVFVRVLLGLLDADRGTVWRRPGLRIGYVPQRMQVDPVLPLTVGRFLTLGGAAAAGEVDAALAETGIGAFARASIHDLSGGEFQRMALARALLRKPDLLVLDEPVQGVDIGGQHELYRLIQRVRDRRGCGIVLVSHDLHLVMASTDRVVCLNRHVCCTGHPETVSRDPAYLELFGRDMARDVAVYVHDHDHRHDPGGNVVEMPADRPQAGHRHD